MNGIQPITQSEQLKLQLVCILYIQYSWCVYCMYTIRVTYHYDYSKHLKHSLVCTPQVHVYMNTFIIIHYNTHKHTLSLIYILVYSVADCKFILLTN